MPHACLAQTPSPAKHTTTLLLIPTKHNKTPNKAATDALIASIGREKAVVDEAVEAGRGDEEAAAALQAEVSAFAAEVSCV